MHFLFISHRYWPIAGGSEKYVQEMAERLIQDGHSATVYTTNADEIDHLVLPNSKSLPAGNEAHNGVQIRRFPVRHYSPQHILRKVADKIPCNIARILIRFPAAITPSLWIRSLLPNSYDVIHATASPFYSLFYPALVAANIKKIPFVFTPFFHTGEPRKSSQLGIHAMDFQISIIKRCNIIITQTNVERNNLIQRGIPKEKIIMLGMGINPEEIIGGNGDRFRSRYSINRDTSIILFVGSLNFDKGVFHIIEALNILQKSKLKMKFVFAGELSREFKKYFARQPANIQNKCLLLGTVHGEKKKDLFASSDIYVMPSRSDSYGIAYLEAWAAKKPVIGCFAGGVPEVISDGHDGFLIPFGDSDMLGSYIKILVQKPQLRNKFGKNGYKKVMKNCTWDHRYKVFKTALLNLLDRK